MSFSIELVLSILRFQKYRNRYLYLSLTKFIVRSYSLLPVISSFSCIILLIYYNEHLIFLQNSNSSIPCLSSVCYGWHKTTLSLDLWSTELISWSLPQSEKLCSDRPAQEARQFPEPERFLLCVCHKLLFQYGLYHYYNPILQRVKGHWDS